MREPRTSAVVTAFGPSPLLGECVTALLGSTGVRTEVVVVDNGGTGAAVEEVAGTPGVRVLRPGRNTGFAGGCNLGVAASSAE
ncbi:MAG: glycosyltransferase family 2 protein, partial [Nocardioidaceae bacterium]